jgi:G3E family GTPase
MNLAARPLALFTGILGAGKTTLLRTLLPVLQRLGVPARVVINDYHNAAVDAETLAHLTSEVTAVSGSCVCCDSRDELFDVLALPPRQSGEVILVETNGTTDTLELLEALATDSRTSAFQPLQVCLVDCQRWQLSHWQQELEARQAQTASHVVFTRGGLVSRTRGAAVKASLRSRNRRAVVTNPERLGHQLKRLAEQRRWFIPTAVRTRGLIQAAQRIPSAGRLRVEPVPSPGPNHHHAALSHGFTSIELNLPGDLTEQQVLAWLERLPDQVLRVKGLARLRGEPDVFGSFQRVGRVPEFLRYPFVSRERTASRAILIGPNLDADALVRLTERALQPKAPSRARRARPIPAPTSHESE